MIFKKKIFIFGKKLNRERKRSNRGTLFCLYTKSKLFFPTPKHLNFLIETGAINKFLLVEEIQS